MGVMSFDDRFELGELLRDDGIRTFLAREKTGGQELLAHFFTSPEAASLLSGLDRLPERERQRIVDRGERGGAPYVVTGSLAGHAGFREWLAANARGGRPLDAAGAWKVIPAQPSVDEQFLSLFPTVERPQARPSDERFPAAAEETPARPQPPEAGEFTRMFQAPSPQPASAQPAAQNTNEPGEFTRLFQAQPAPAQPAIPQPPKKSDGPGEFTRFFEAQVHQAPAHPPKAHEGQTLGVQPVPQAPKQGEFTRVFGLGEVRNRMEAPQPPAEMRVPEPAPQATRAFASPPAVPQAPVPPSTPAQGHGEYTVRFSAAPALTLGQPGGQPGETPAALSPSTANAASPRSSSSRWPLILGIAAIAVLLVAVALFLLSRAK
jgi:hypothetical protein